MKPRIIQFPTKVFFIDDNFDFVKDFYSIKNRYSSNIGDEPLQALNEINKLTSKDIIKQLLIHQEESNDLAAEGLLKRLEKTLIEPPILYHTVVVDYGMPMMNGVKFCRAIKDDNIKKIILTAQADEEVAINAFNEGIINYFIKKSTSRLLNKIDELILNYQEDYFFDMSEMLIGFFKGTILEEIYNHKTFWELFNILIHNQKIVSFIAYDSSGCFALKDYHGSIYLLNAYSESEISNIVLESDFLKDIDQSEKEKLCNFNEFLDYKHLGDWRVDFKNYHPNKLQKPIFTIDSQEKIFFTFRHIS